MAQIGTQPVKPCRYTARSSSKEARQARFLYFFLETPNKKEAAKHSGVPIRTVHRWFKEDPSFYSDAQGIFDLCHMAVLHRRIMDAFAELSSRL